MNIQNIQSVNTDGSIVEWVQIETAPNEFTVMLKADYEASTLPSNSSIPQAGE